MNLLLSFGHEVKGYLIANNIPSHHDKKTRKIYSKAFKQKAVELSPVRGSVPHITQELEVEP
jgi:hypothetical protein